MSEVRGKKAKKQKTLASVPQDASAKATFVAANADQSLPNHGRPPLVPSEYVQLPLFDPPASATFQMQKLALLNIDAKAESSSNKICFEDMRKACAAVHGETTALAQFPEAKTKDDFSDKEVVSPVVLRVSDRFYRLDAALWPLFFNIFRAILTKQNQEQRLFFPRVINVKPVDKDTAQKEEKEAGAHSLDKFARAHWITALIECTQPQFSMLFEDNE